MSTAQDRKKVLPCPFQFFSYCNFRLLFDVCLATRMGFTSPTFVLLDLFPHLRLLTFCLASSSRHQLGNSFRYKFGLTSSFVRPYFNLSLASLSALQLATPAFEQSACRVTRKVLLFCVCWFSFDKAKKNSKTQKKRKKNRTHGGHRRRALANQRHQPESCLWHTSGSLES